MNIFITGGEGYVGSSLVPFLLDQGHKVFSYDTNYFGYRNPDHKNYKSYTGDIRNFNTLVSCMKGSDVVIHLASLSNDISCELNPELAKEINKDAIYNIIEACNTNDVDRLLVASSTSQYGAKSLDIDVTEDVKAEPLTDYARYKIEAEQMIRNSNLSSCYTFIRPGTICGYSPRMRFDLMINAMTINMLVRSKCKVFGGEQLRPVINMKDMVEFYTLLCSEEESLINKQAFNVATDNYTAMEAAVIIKDELNGEIEVEEVSDDGRSYHINTQKAKDVLGFNTSYNIRDAVRSIKEAYDNRSFIDPLTNSQYYNIKRMKQIYE